MNTLEPFLRYCSAILHRFSLKTTTECHSVFSRRSPVVLSRQVSEVAMRRLAMGRPSCVRRISGSLPRLPTRMTLLTEPAIAASSHFDLECRGRCRTNLLAYGARLAAACQRRAVLRLLVHALLGLLLGLRSLGTGHLGLRSSWAQTGT